MPSKMRFRALRIDPANSRWRQLFREFWPAYRSWYLSGPDSRPSLAESRKALQQHMPELLPLWKDLTRVAGDDPEAGQMLTLYRPPAYIFGCSQAVWVQDEPFLIRNYDYSPDLAEGVILHTQWLGTPVIGMSDCLWGLVDGVNEHGLAVSLTFGGRKQTGDGFGIPLILRYVLQIARNTAEAVGILRRIPSHMSYNVLVLDRAGDYALVQLAPDRPPEVSQARLSTNHQVPGDWPEYEKQTRTLERTRFIAGRLSDQAETPETFIERFAADPLYHTGFEQAFGTLYTAVYKPESGRVEYIWPGFVSRQSIDKFREGEAHIVFGEQRLEVEDALYPALSPQTQEPAATPPEPASQDWRKFIVEIPGDWQRYLPEWMR